MTSGDQTERREKPRRELLLDLADAVRELTEPRTHNEYLEAVEVETVTGRNGTQRQRRRVVRRRHTVTLPALLDALRDAAVPGPESAQLMIDTLRAEVVRLTEDNTRLREWAELERRQKDVAIEQRDQARAREAGARASVADEIAARDAHKRTGDEARAALADSETKRGHLVLFASWLATIRNYDDNPHMLGPRDITLQDIIDRARLSLDPESLAALGEDEREAAEQPANQKGSSEMSYRWPYTVHDLKTVAPYYDAVAREAKTFEIRKDDRGFQPGDLLVLREWIDSAQCYSPAPPVFRKVTYVLRDGTDFGVAAGVAVLGLQPVNPPPIAD